MTCTRKAQCCHLRDSSVTVLLAVLPLSGAVLRSSVGQLHFSVDRDSWWEPAALSKPPDHSPPWLSGSSGLRTPQFNPLKSKPEIFLCVHLSVQRSVWLPGRAGSEGHRGMGGHPASLCISQCRNLQTLPLSSPACASPHKLHGDSAEQFHSLLFFCFTTGIYFSAFDLAFSS